MTVADILNPARMKIVKSTNWFSKATTEIQESECKKLRPDYCIDVEHQRGRRLLVARWTLRGSKYALATHAPEGSSADEIHHLRRRLNNSSFLSMLYLDAGV